ncbi:peptidoglycan-binding domain-containing protein [Niallia nealsonii]|uniref:Peptidoglycan binding-like domain-containing protein n=1 Tax=Niallia nealsonii TaxID=115979 RepID=A0A2N0Z4G7_9BACI|nr:peptidoglycan-binding domain-containing protein [Niallia nealsonii]PKG24408.1 hypothetical protein CWS01_07210 [Niallia nealsonii]
MDVDFVPPSKKIAPSIEKGKFFATWNKFVQGMLYLHGYDPKGFDGIFGTGMLAAIKKFQKEHGLTADGIVGLNTFVKFFA